MSRRTFTDEFDGLDEWGAEHLVRSRWLHEPNRYRGRQERIYAPKAHRLRQRQRWQRKPAIVRRKTNMGNLSGVFQRLGRLSGVAVPLSMPACYGAIVSVSQLALVGLTASIHEGASQERFVNPMPRDSTSSE